MNSHSAKESFVLALCVLALFVTQTFGSRAGYLCLCAGTPVQTQTSHCHGPHGEQCHAAGGDTAAPHDEEDSGPREDHQVVNQDVQWRPVEAAPQVIAPQGLIAVLPLEAVLFAGRETKVPACYSVDLGKSPPFGVTVARTIVLLI